MNEARPISFEQFAKDQTEWQRMTGMQRRIIAAWSRNRRVIFVPARRYGLKEVNRLQHRYNMLVQNAGAK